MAERRPKSRPDAAAELKAARDDERVEITLVMDGRTFRRLRSRLDALVAEYDLNTRVSRG